MPLIASTSGPSAQPRRGWCSDAMTSNIRRWAAQDSGGSLSRNRARVRRSGCSPARMTRWRSGARKASRTRRRRCEVSGAASSVDLPCMSRESIWCADRRAATRTGSALRGRSEAARTSVRPLWVESRSGSFRRRCVGSAGSTAACSPEANRGSSRRRSVVGKMSSTPSRRTSIRRMWASGCASFSASSGTRRRRAAASASSRAGPETRRGVVSFASRRAPCCNGAET